MKELPDLAETYWRGVRVRTSAFLRGWGLWTVSGLIAVVAVACVSDATKGWDVTLRVVLQAVAFVGAVLATISGAFLVSMLLSPIRQRDAARGVAKRLLAKRARADVLRQAKEILNGALDEWTRINSSGRDPQTAMLRWAGHLSQFGGFALTTIAADRLLGVTERLNRASRFPHEGSAAMFAFRDFVLHLAEDDVDPHGLCSGQTWETWTPSIAPEAHRLKDPRGAGSSSHTVVKMLEDAADEGATLLSKEHSFAEHKVYCDKVDALLSAALMPRHALAARQLIREQSLTGPPPRSMQFITPQSATQARVDVVQGLLVDADAEFAPAFEPVQWMTWKPST